MASMRRAVPDDFERMWTDLSPVGRSASSGGYFRQPFTAPERELHACHAREGGAKPGAAADVLHQLAGIRKREHDGGRAAVPGDRLS